MYMIYKLSNSTTNIHWQITLTKRNSWVEIRQVYPIHSEIGSNENGIFTPSKNKPTKTALITKLLSVQSK